MKKPVIGVLPLWDEEKSSIWMLPGYMQGIEAAGGIPAMLSLTADKDALQHWAETLDGFLLTGGHDVNPALYGEAKTALCGVLSEERDRIETCLLKKVIAQGKPAFGICRGLQLFNAALGGTLYQDIPAQMANPLVHEAASANEVVCHEVTVAEGTPLSDIAGSVCLVNSYHHQGIKDLAAGLTAEAFSRDGLVEAVRMAGIPFIFAVQWHPELNFEQDKVSFGLFGQLIDYAKGQAD